jgi:hypothetical protein
MFKYALVLGFSLSLLVGRTQEVDSSLATRYRPGFMWFFGGLRPSSLVDARKYDRFIVDIVYNDWLKSDQKPFQTNFNSIGMNLQLFFDIPLTDKNTIALGVGLGYGHTKINYDQYLERIALDGSTALVSYFPSGHLEKSVFKTNKIFIPVELRFRTPGWKHVKLHFGGRAGYQFGASTKIITNEHPSAAKNKDFYDLNPFSLSVNTRLGIRNWALTAAYNLTPYFKNSSSTKLNGFELGISVSLF